MPSRLILGIRVCASFLSLSFPLPGFPGRARVYDVVVIEMRFETGDEKLKELEVGVFVGAGRFVVEQDKPVVVEYKLSKVSKGR